MKFADYKYKKKKKKKKKKTCVKSVQVSYTNSSNQDHTAHPRS